MFALSQAGNLRTPPYITHNVHTCKYSPSHLTYKKPHIFPSVMPEGVGTLLVKVEGKGVREVVGDTYLIRTAIGKVCPASTSNLMMTFRAWPCLRP